MGILQVQGLQTQTSFAYSPTAFAPLACLCWSFFHPFNLSQLPFPKELSFPRFSVLHSLTPCFLWGHWGPAIPGKGNKLMPQACQGWTRLAPRTKGRPGIGTYLSDPEVSCSGAHPCPTHLKLVSLTMTLLRHDLRKNCSWQYLPGSEKKV